MRERILRLGVTMFLFALAVRTSSAENGEPNVWSRLSPEIRKQLHTNAYQVPPYPEDDCRLMNVRLWPKARTFDGKEYMLEYSAWRLDAIRSAVRSLSEIDSGWKYEAHYVRYSRNGKRRTTRGPRFMWYPDSTLCERSYRTPSSNQTWNYDLQGNLRVYVETVRGSGCRPGNSRTESFETDGSLAGFEMLRPRKYYWKGQELEWEEYASLRNKLWKWE